MFSHCGSFVVSFWRKVRQMGSTVGLRNETRRFGKHKAVLSFALVLTSILNWTLKDLFSLNTFFKRGEMPQRNFFMVLST